jgi:hypothetical protein
MSKIVNLTQYDLVFTSSFENVHGISGHLYEMIDYYYITTTAGIKSAMLLSDGTTRDMLTTAVLEKYDFTDTEVQAMLDSTIECYQPKIIIANQLCVVDGSPRFGSCTIYADHVWLMRCAAKDYSYFHEHKSIKKTHLLQDFNLYTERYEDIDIDVVDYTKKILWSKYKSPTTSSKNAGLLYLTTNCRGIDLDAIRQVISKQQCDSYLIVTNDIAKYQPLQSDTVRVEQAPVKDILSQFDTYIYTAIPTQFDCSPRFIVECAVFGKDVVYEIDYIDPGIECRKAAMSKDLNSLLLTTQDDFIKYING